LLREIEGYLAAAEKPPLGDAQKSALMRTLPVVKGSAKMLPQLLEKAHFSLTQRPIEIEEKAAKALDDVSRGILSELTFALQRANWSREDLEAAVGQVAEAHGLGLGKVAAPMRAALAGRAATSSVFDMMLVLGQEETLARLDDQAA
jgi:glutamyl-tRNA synthetase